MRSSGRRERGRGQVRGERESSDVLLDLQTRLNKIQWVGTRFGER